MWVGCPPNMLLRPTPQTRGPCKGRTSAADSDLLLWGIVYSWTHEYPQSPPPNFLTPWNHQSTRNGCTSTVRLPDTSLDQNLLINNIAHYLLPPRHIRYTFVRLHSKIIPPNHIGTHHAILTLSFPIGSPSLKLA
jgi:hypothetical protein